MPGDWKADKIALAKDALAFVEARSQAPKVEERVGAALAMLAYDGAWAGAPNGYTLWDTAKDGSGALRYQAYALRHHRSRTLVLLNRGSDGLGDIGDAIATARGKFGGQFERAQAFALKQTLNHAGQFDRIMCIGHSLGAGLAEAQVALLGSASKGALDGISIEGIGTGSASFAAAIRGYAKKNGLEINPNVRADMTHYIRAADAVSPLNGGENEHLGNVEPVPDFYEPHQQEPPGGHGLIWLAAALPIHNHAQELYYAHFDTHRPKTKCFLFRFKDDAHCLIQGAPFKQRGTGFPPRFNAPKPTDQFIWKRPA